MVSAENLPGPFLMKMEIK